MTLRAVLFDLDGVLVDSGGAWYRVVSRGLARWGGRPITYAEFLATFGQGVEADRRQFFPERTAAEVAAFYEAGFAEQTAAVELCPGARETLDALGRRGILRAVVTNTPADLARRVLADKGLASRLEAVAAAGEAAEKPAPDLVQLALARLGVAPAEAVYVGDSESDRQAARAAGVRMIGLGHDGDARIATLADLLPLVDAARPGPGQGA